MVSWEVELLLRAGLWNARGILPCLAARTYRRERYVNVTLMSVSLDLISFASDTPSRRACVVYVDSLLRVCGYPIIRRTGLVYVHGTDSCRNGATLPPDSSINITPPDEASAVSDHLGNSPPCACVRSCVF